MTSSIPTDIKHIVRTPDVFGGRPCIEGHRIAVHDVAALVQQGYTPEQIVAQHYPTLTLAQVYAALVYYYEHKDEIDREIQEESAFVRKQAAKDTAPQHERLSGFIRTSRMQLR